MPDRPDYSAYAPNSSRFSLQDLGELAVRLGSYNSFDRRGEQVWSDDFSTGLNDWSMASDPAGGTFKLVAGKRYLSPYQAQITCPTTGNKFVSLTHYLPTGILGKVGCEIALYPENDFTNFYMLLTYNNLTRYFQSQVLVRKNTDIIQISDKTSGLVKIGKLSDYYKLDTSYHVVKLVMDFENGNYIRFMFDDFEKGLSSYSLPVTTASSNSNFRLDLGFTGVAASASIFDHANVIVTSNDE